MKPNWAERYGQWLVHNRALALFTLCVLTALASFGIWDRLQKESPVDFTPQSLFMGDGDEWDRLQSYEAEFGAEDNTMVIIVEGPTNSWLT